MEKHHVDEALHEIGHIIDTDAMAGRGPNGNLDTSDTLEKAEEIFEYLMDFMIDHVKENIKEQLEEQTERVVDTETYERLTELRKEDHELDKVLKNVDTNYTSDVMKHLHVEFDHHITHKRRYNNL